MAFVPLDPTETEFKAPIDETLMEKIRENFDDHESRLGGGGGGGGGIAFKVNGGLVKLKGLIDSEPSFGRILDGALVTAGQTFSRVRLFLKKNGTSGQTKIDIKRHRRVNHPIEFVNAQLDRNVQAVGRVGSPLSTQAVTKRTPQINTQSIARAKSTLTAESVVVIDGTKARYNIAGGTLLDADYKVGQKAKVASMINGANNGEFTILEVNPDGWPGLILDNSSAVNETGSSGSVDLQFFAYIFTNPADVVGFKVGENMIAASHTLGANNGSFEIVRINDGGNNLLVYNNNAGADVQGAPAGTVDGPRWVYTFAAAVNTGDYFQEETAFFSGHTSGANNGNFLIKEINETGNNLVVYNETGAVQAGSGGTVETNRWTYSTNTDPSPDIAVGDLIRFENMTSANNDGDFELKEINRFALFNLTVFNESGVAQGAPAGTVRSELVIVGFDTDFSSFYEAGRSIATIKSFVNDVNNGFFDVIELNRGGGAANNIVVKNFDSIDEADPIGQVDLESRSIFDSNLPTITTGEDIDFAGGAAVFNPASVEVDSMVALDVLELPDGVPEDLSVDLS